MIPSNHAGKRIPGIMEREVVDFMFKRISVLSLCIIGLSYPLFGRAQISIAEMAIGSSVEGKLFNVMLSPNSFPLMLGTHLVSAEENFLNKSDIYDLFPAKALFIFNNDFQDKSLYIPVYLYAGCNYWLAYADAYGDETTRNADYIDGGIGIDFFNSDQNLFSNSLLFSMFSIRLGCKHLHYFSGIQIKDGLKNFYLVVSYSLGFWSKKD